MIGFASLLGHPPPHQSSTPALLHPPIAGLPEVVPKVAMAAVALVMVVVVATAAAVSYSNGSKMVGLDTILAWLVGGGRIDFFICTAQ